MADWAEQAFDLGPVEPMRRYDCCQKSSTQAALLSRRTHLWMKGHQRGRRCSNRKSRGAIYERANASAVGALCLLQVIQIRNEKGALQNSPPFPVVQPYGCSRRFTKLCR
jgi:hypothetical protein